MTVDFLEDMQNPPVRRAWRDIFSQQVHHKGIIENKNTPKYLFQRIPTNSNK